jgi:hypothetical protein
LYCPNRQMITKKWKSETSLCPKIHRDDLHCTNLVYFCLCYDQICEQTHKGPVDTLSFVQTMEGVKTRSPKCLFEFQYLLQTISHSHIGSFFRTTYTSTKHTTKGSSMSWLFDHALHPTSRMST